MSFVLHCWEHPADRPQPEDIWEASKLLDELHESSPGQNARFIAWAHALTRRYPCSCSPEAAALPYEARVWSEGPLDGLIEDAVYSLGIRSEHIDPVRGFVITEANRFGLNVMDEQAGEVYLANGTILSVRDPNARPLRAAELKERVSAFACKMLARYGFQPRIDAGHTLFRETPEGWQAIVVAVQGDNAFTFDGLGQQRPAIDLLNTLTSIPDPEKIADAVNYLVEQKDWVDKNECCLNEAQQFVVNGRKELETVLDRALAHVQKDLLPLLDKCTHLDGLVEQVCTVPLSASKFFFNGPWGCHALALAWMAKHPQLQAMCREVDFNTAHADYNQNPYTQTARDFIAYIGEQMDWPMPQKQFLFQALPYIRTRAQIEAMNIVPGHESSPVVTDMRNGLFIIYLYEHKDRWKHVTHQQTSDFQMTEGELRQVAGINMHNLRVDKKMKVQQHGLLTLFTGTHMFEASTLADDAYWESLREISLSFIAAIPSRDVLAICSPKDKEAIAELRALMEHGSGSNPDHQLSKDLYMLWDGKWQIYG